MWRTASRARASWCIASRRARQRGRPRGCGEEGPMIWRRLLRLVTPEPTAAERAAAARAERATREAETKAWREAEAKRFEAAQEAEWAERVAAAHEVWLEKIRHNGGVDDAGFASAG